MLSLSNNISSPPSSFKHINTIDLTAFSSWTGSDVDTFEGAVYGGLGWEAIDNDDDWVVYSSAFTVPSHASKIVVIYDIDLTLLQADGDMLVKLSSQTDGGGTNTTLATYTNSSTDATGVYHMVDANTAYTRLVFRDNASEDKQTWIAKLTNCYVHILQ
tara:strand:- start:167 stop:643 length:477 start_codon:yes stop_codon:yes gene_type:complete